MQSVSISIAMGTYNGASYLREQLASLAGQENLPCELVVCDDGSRDETVEILTEFAKGAPFPVRIVRNAANLGYADNFMQAASLCIGECVAFCDQDDIWDSQKLGTAATAMDNPETMLFSHGCQLISGTGATLRAPEAALASGIYRLADLDPMNAFFGYSCVFRRTLLDLCASAQRPPDLINPDRLLAHDRWIYFLATATGTIVYDARPLVLYRQHGHNCMGSETLRRKNVGRLLSDVRFKYNAYLYKRTALAQGLYEVSQSIAAQGRAQAPDHLLAVYADMFSYYSARLALFHMLWPVAVFAAIRLKLSHLYDTPRRYANARAFLEDVAAIFIAQRMVTMAAK